MKYDIHPEKGYINRGNLYRIKEMMRRAEAGDRITIGFLGGSITQGAVSEYHSNCYAHLVYEWFVQKFPKSAFTYANAGIGGTTSYFGVARVDRDLMVYHPDLVFIEFSVNDDNNLFFKETYEGLVRHVYSNALQPAVALIHNIMYDHGTTAQEIHSQIGQHYELPCVAMQPTIYERVKAGEIPNREITPDDLHPNALGHSLVASVVISMLDEIYAQLSEEEEPSAFNRKLPEALTQNRYENTYRIQNGVHVPFCDRLVAACVREEGFEVDETPQRLVLETQRNGWQARKKGDRIHFELEAECIGIQYIKTVHKPAPIAKVTVDGDSEHAVILDANFEEDWGDCLYLQPLEIAGGKGMHTLDIEVIESHEKDAHPFYLVSVLASL